MDGENDNVEKMLGEKPEEEEGVEDEEGGKDGDPEGEGAVEGDKEVQGSDAERGKERSRKLVEQLKRRQARERALKEENEALRKRLEEKGKEGIEEIQAMTPEQLREAAKTNQAAKAWLDLIREEARAEAAAAAKPQRDAAYRSAVTRFAKAHPECAATAEGRDKFRKVEAIAKRNGLDAAGDEESMLDILNRSYAFHSPAAPERDPGRDRANRFAAQAGSPGAGVRGTGDDYSAEEVAAAEKAGMTPEQYRAASSVYGDGNRIGI